jgi:hypothetical protein
LFGPHGFAGSGGCTFCVLSPDGDGYKFVCMTDLVHPPLVPTTSRSRGWHSLIAQIGGGGQEPRFVQLDFDGKRYPKSGQDGKVLPSGTGFSGTAVFGYNQIEHPLQLVVR